MQYSYRVSIKWNIKYQMWKWISTYKIRGLWARLILFTMSFFAQNWIMHFIKMLVYPQRIMAGYLSSWSKKAPVLSYEGIIYCWKMGQTKICALISTFHEIYFAMEKLNRDLL